jgi:hypothetical protein
MNSLLDAIILNDEVLCLQSVDGVPLRVSHQRRDGHQVGLGTEARLLLRRSRPEKQQ